MKNFLMCSLALLSLSAAYGAPVDALVVKDQKPSAELAAAVKDNYAYGRMQSDFGGVAAVEIKKLSTTEGDLAAVELEAILAKLIKESNAASDESLAGICQVELEVNDTQNCAQKIVADYEINANRLSALDETLASIAGDSSATSPQARQFAQNIHTIEKNVEQLVGADADQFALPISVMNVDAGLYVLISKDRKTVVLLKWDLGA